MSYRFSARSQKILETVNPVLQKIFHEAIETSPIDFGIPNTGGLRTPEMQNVLFADGKSKCDGYDKKSKHQSGNAVDVYAYLNGRASWDVEHLALIAGVVLATAQRQGVSLRWGGTFGKQGKVFKGWDRPHFELRHTK